MRMCAPVVDVDVPSLQTRDSIMFGMLASAFVCGHPAACKLNKQRANNNHPPALDLTIQL